MSANSIYSIGYTSLLNAQAGISVASNNIANVDTPGYTRQTVTTSSTPYITLNGQTVGTGAEIEEIARHYNSFLGGQYRTASAQQAMWYTVSDYLYGNESLFNDSSEYGLSTALDNYLGGWNALTQNPASEAARSELLGYAKTYTDMLRQTSAGLDEQITILDDRISDNVTRVNELTAELAEINTLITGRSDDPGLLDSQAMLLDELSALVDIQTVPGSNGQVTVQTGEGLTLVSSERSYDLALLPPRATADLTTGSGFDGAVYFSGTCSDEVTVEFVTGGNIGAGAQFRVSLDGGETWVTDESGETAVFDAGGESDPVEVAGVSIWFGTKTDSAALPSAAASEGDSFSIVAKKGLYWLGGTSEPVNITPQGSPLDAGGGVRLSGGALAGLLSCRDEYMGDYQAALDTLAYETIWETNYAHSQGAGLTHRQQAFGDYPAADTSAPASESGLFFADEITSGSMSFAIYDEATGDPVGVTELDFSSVPPGIATFDPDVHSIEDVASVINASFPGMMTATVDDGRLSLAAEDGYSFEFAGDSTGLLAACGLNTFFTGTDAGSIAVTPGVTADPARVNTGHVNGAGEVNEGDTATADALSDLSDRDITFQWLDSSSTMTISEFMHTLSSRVGTDSLSAQQRFAYADTIANGLQAQKTSFSGVNLDEELTSLTRYQQNYETASKLIQTAREMIDTVLGLI